MAAIGTGADAGMLVLKTEGTATITASQAGNDMYAAAPPVTQVIMVEAAPSTVLGLERHRRWLRPLPQPDFRQVALQRAGCGVPPLWHRRPPTGDWQECAFGRYYSTPRGVVLRGGGSWGEEFEVACGAGVGGRENYELGIGNYELGGLSEP